MWSLMDLNALEFVSTSYRLSCSSGGGFIRFKFRLNLECDCGILTLTSFPSEFMIHWNINSYGKNRTTPKKIKKKQFYKKGLRLTKKTSSEMKLSKLTKIK